MKITNLGRTVTYRNQDFNLGDTVELRNKKVGELPLYFKIHKFVPTKHYSGRVLDHVEVLCCQRTDFSSMVLIKRYRMASLKKLLSNTNQSSTANNLNLIEGKNHD
jgi:hypothetical protein